MPQWETGDHSDSFLERPLHVLGQLSYFLARFAWRFSFSVFLAGFFSMLFFVFLSFVAMPTSL